MSSSSGATPSRLRRAGRALLLAAALPVLGAWYWPMTNDAEVAKGQAAYRAGDFAAAASAFRRAMRGKGDSNRIQYDLGTALLQSAMAAKDETTRNALLDRGIAALHSATDSTDSELRVRALYNLGNALALRSRYDDAIASYKKALRIDVDHDDARFNLELVLMARKSASSARPAGPGAGAGSEGEGRAGGEPGAGARGQESASQEDRLGSQGAEGGGQPGRSSSSASGQEEDAQEAGESSLKAQTDYPESNAQHERSVDNLTLIQKLQALERRSGELRRGNLLRKSRARLRNPNKKGAQQ